MSAGLAIGRRYHAARLREHYNRWVGREVQPERRPPITKKKLGEVQAKFFLFVRPNGQAQHGDREYETFLRTIKHGKRWLRLEREFGCGIFALLPKSRVSNTYVERTLTDNLFLLWLRVLSHCSPLVVRLAKDLTSVIAQLADDLPPPASRLRLEDMGEELPESEEPTEDLVDLVEQAGKHPRVCELPNSDEEASPPRSVSDLGSIRRPFTEHEWEQWTDTEENELVESRIDDRTEGDSVNSETSQTNQTKEGHPLRPRYQLVGSQGDEGVESEDENNVGSSLYDEEEVSDGLLVLAEADIH
ncbi:hypothetical protein J1614_012173 [Plenodomus biglobosus]|nr:hypothetical protein J1614_012173 [Plenodomus biglobosus]